jgi:predicted transcriptional regulator
MRTYDRSMLLSVRPRFATGLLNGTKTVELRRQAPNVREGSLVILYSASPVSAVVGRAVVAEIVLSRPDAVWQRYGALTGLEEAEYYQYFEGCETACALVLVDPRTFRSPTNLDYLRKSVGVEPPQSFRYLAFDQVRRLCLSDDELSDASEVASGRSDGKQLELS